MPWKATDAHKHKDGLTGAQAVRWKNIANKVLADCLDAGGDQEECEGKAIRIANSQATRPPGNKPGRPAKNDKKGKGKGKEEATEGSTQ